MKLQRIVLIAFLILPTICSSQRRLEPRIADGIPIDKFNRFPHHVNIRTITNIKADNNGIGDGSYDDGRDCSGSIIAEQWILTSIGCIHGGIRYRLDFHRLYLNNTKGSYSVLIDNNSIYQYPTEYDDLALIKIPLRFDFISASSPTDRSSSIKPISLYTEQEQDDEHYEVNYNNNKNFKNNQFSVMPGFTDNKDKLTYGMFRIISNDECKRIYGNQFDEYYQLCTRGWNNIKQVPCKGNEGGGLLIGWPHNPQLIGVFSTPLSCKYNEPAIYIKISKYIDWIESVIGNDVKSSTPGPSTSITTPYRTTTTAFAITTSANVF